MNKSKAKMFRDLKVRKPRRIEIPYEIVDVVVLNNSSRNPLDRPIVTGHVDPETRLLLDICVSYDGQRGQY